MTLECLNKFFRGKFSRRCVFYVNLLVAAVGFCVNILLTK